MQSLSELLPPGDGDPGLHHGARRRHVRVALHADVEIISPVPAAGLAINASAGGMRIALDQPLAVGELVVARVVTAKGRETLERARVVWCRSLPDGALVGLAFVAVN